MATPRQRVGLDANVLIAGTRLPRWPYEVMQAARQGRFDLILPEQVILEARRHIESGRQRTMLERFLKECDYKTISRPTREQRDSNLDLVRSRRDVSIALALLDARADIFVTSDRDFTDAGATAPRFTEQVQVMLPAVFLRQVLGWSSAELEAIRFRRWEELPLDNPPGGEGR